MRNVILNRSNIVAGSNNSKFTYEFPSTAEFKDDQIAISNINLNVSWQNINNGYNNDFFQYIFYDAGGATTYNVNIPNGNYSLAQLNAFLQYRMIQDGNYLIDSTGDYVYFLDIVVNPTSYAYEIRADPIPTALPGGWTNPAGMTFPAVASTPQMVIPATNIQTLLGFPAGTYPAVTQATPYNILSPNIPQIATISSIIVLCTLVNNRFQYPNTIIYSFLATGDAGTPINITPPEYIFVDIVDGYYGNFELQFVDQNFNPMILEDPEILIQLIFKKRSTPLMK